MIAVLILLVMIPRAVAIAPNSTQNVPLTSVKVVISTLPTPKIYARQQAIMGGVDIKIVLSVIKCESNWKNIQSNLYNKRRKHREMSFGIAQINVLAHPNITKAEAYDKYFSIRYLVSEVASGRGRQWTCYRIITKKRTVQYSRFSFSGGGRIILRQ